MKHLRKHQRCFRIIVVIAVLAGTLPVSAMQRSAAEESSPWWKNAVCYEIFVRSFQDSDGDGIGDLNGITERLDYLNDGQPGGSDLGVTCLWLMPIFPSPTYHGYDVTDYYDVNPDYGTLADLDFLIQEAAERKISILLDLPINHSSSQHPWFQNALDPESPYRDWYIWSDTNPGYAGPWGQNVWHDSPAEDGTFYYGLFTGDMPDLNLSNAAVTMEIESIAGFWLDRGIRGFRIDAAKHLIEEGQIQENAPATHQWLAGFNAWLDQEYPGIFVIGEIFNAGAFMLDSYYEPEQLDAYFQFEIAAQIVIAVDSGSAGGLRSIVQDAIAKNPAQEWGTFLTNHDQPRSMVEFDGDLAKAELAAVALLTLPGLPFVYYGEEIGMWGTKPDEQIRSPMQWSRLPDSGFSTGTPWRPFEHDAAWVNVENQQGDPRSLLTLYRHLIDLRTTRTSLAVGEVAFAQGGDQRLLAYVRFTDQETTLVILNVGKDSMPLTELAFAEDVLEPGIWLADTLLGGQPVPDLLVGEDGVLSVAANESLSIPAQSALVLELTPVSSRATPVAAASPTT